MRDQYKWLDTRFAWSAGAALFLAYFMSVNAVAPSRFSPHDASYFAYDIAMLLGSGFFFLSLAQVALGMSASFTPWSRKSRKNLGCTSFMWMRNTTDYKTAAAFVSHVISLDEAAVREAKAEEIWRLSALNEQKQEMLMWARLCTVALGACVFVFALLVLPISGSLKLNLFH